MLYISQFLIATYICVNEIIIIIIIIIIITTTLFVCLFTSLH
jgi:hypothetical protein